MLMGIDVVTVKDALTISDPHLGRHCSIVAEQYERTEIQEIEYDKSLAESLIVIYLPF
jgi:hypothetical protein